MHSRSTQVMFLVSASILAMALASLAQAAPNGGEPAPVPSERAYDYKPNSGAPGHYTQDPDRDYPGMPSCYGGVIYSGVPCVNDIPYGPR